MAPDRYVGGDGKRPMGRLQPTQPALLSRRAMRGQSTRPMALSIDSSIDLSIDPATALAPSLVGHPARRRATVRGRVGSRLEAGLRRAVRQTDPLALNASKPLEQRAARLNRLVIGIVGGDAFPHVEHLVLPCDSSQCSAQIAELAARAYALLHCNRSQPRRRRATTGDLGTAFLRFKPRASPRQFWALAIALNMKINFGVPKCRTGAVGAARVHKAKSLRNFQSACLGAPKRRIESARVPTPIGYRRGRQPPVAAAGQALVGWNLKFAALDTRERLASQALAG